MRRKLVKKIIGIIILVLIIGTMFTSCSCESCGGGGSKSTSVFGTSIKSSCSACGGRGIDISKTFFLIAGIGVVIAIISLIASNKSWTYNYNNNTITVKNSPSTGELLINGQMVDKKTSALSAQMTLQSKLDSGEIVEAHLGGGFFTVDCNVKVDGKLLTNI